MLKKVLQAGEKWCYIKSPILRKEWGTSEIVTIWINAKLFGTYFLLSISLLTYNCLRWKKCYRV